MSTQKPAVNKAAKKLVSYSPLDNHDAASPDAQGAQAQAHAILDSPGTQPQLRERGQEPQRAPPRAQEHKVTEPSSRASDKNDAHEATPPGK